MYKRSGILLSVFLFLFTIIYLRVFLVSNNQELQEAANQNNYYTIDVDKTKGQIYDCNFEKLVNEEDKYSIAVVPSIDSINALSSILDADKKSDYISFFEKGRPFILSVDNPYIEGNDLTLLTTKKRYSDHQLASHMIGYTDYENQGVVGIEKAYNDFLNSTSGDMSVSFEVTALRSALNGTTPTINNNNYDNAQGVVLTIDKTIQSIVEQVGRQNIEKGAIVVMDVESGYIKAAASFPSFNPNNISEVINDDDAPLLNRTLSSYPVGSVFKTAVMSAAIEDGISTDYTYECKGHITVDGTVFRCDNLAVHGKINMNKALQVSCNTYFINLALNEIGLNRVYQTAINLGFETKDEIAPNMIASQGTLPTLKDLENDAEFANFSFGQGKLTATPIQIAKLMSTIANGGYAVTPTITLGTSDQTGTHLLNAEGNPKPIRIIDEKTAKTVRNAMEDVVLLGSGKNALPEYGGSGGKTGSAQTGIYDENGKEIVHAWFAGYFPAEQPKYAIVVLNEGATSGSKYAAPLFKEIADRVNEYNNYKKEWSKLKELEEKLLKEKEEKQTSKENSKQN